MTNTKISNLMFACLTNYNALLGKAKPVVLAGFLVIGLFAQPAEAALTFGFNYLNPGQGFDDPIFGSKRKAALNSAAGMLGSYFKNYNAHLTYNVSSGSVNEPTLASAGSYSYLTPGSFQPSFVQTKILSNGRKDYNGSAADGDIDWNFFEKWGLTDKIKANEFDFKQIAVHELLHTLGFNSNVRENGKGLGGNAPGTADTWAIFDNFLTDAAGNRLISSAGVFDSTKVAALTGGSGVFFNGANAMAASGGTEIPLYSPSWWQEGSSIAHLDGYNPLMASLLMVPSISRGLGPRTLSAIEIGMLKDIGYASISAPAVVPVPAAIWFMASGLLILFGINRQRKIVL
ncbi:hypothetical protein [Methyloglobulus sp.]|uniref:hypothetical protein n=1 Tax=Methyloglobulus sp. TaxID=2518622 RepID=UPI0032B734C0